LKRILHLTIHLYGAAGAERQLILNVSRLNRLRFESYICCIESPRDLANEAAILDIPVLTLGVSGKIKWPLAIQRLCRLVRRLKIEIIHTSLFDADIIGGIAGRLTGVPVVSTLCNIGGEPERLVDNPAMSRGKLALTTKIWGLVLRYGHRHCIANSNSVMTSAVRTYGLPEGKLTVIYRALSGTWSRHGHGEQLERLRKDLVLDDAYPILLNVGRLVPQKGQRYLIEAMPNVLNQFPKATLLIAGEGPLHESLASECRRLNVDNHIRFLGQRKDVQELLALSDIFAFPSLFEGCPNSLIEALAMGKPCVASCIGPNEEVVQNGVTGVLVPSQSPEALCESIIRLADDRELARTMGERGSRMVVEKFAIDKSIKQLEEVYDHVAGIGSHNAVDREDSLATKVKIRR